MHKAGSLAAVILSVFVVTGNALAGGEKAKWVCSKDGKEVQIKGKHPRNRKKACESQGGTWERQSEAQATDPAASFGSGGGGGGGSGGSGGAGW